MIKTAGKQYIIDQGDVYNLNRLISDLTPGRKNNKTRQYYRRAKSIWLNCNKKKTGKDSTKLPTNWLKKQPAADT